MNGTNNVRDKQMNIIIAILAVIFVGLLVALSYLTVQYNNNNKVVTIYYKGYAKPYIRYRYDTEPWGDIAGEAMPANTDKAYADYTHKIDIPLKGRHEYIMAMFKDDAGNVDDNNSVYYKFEKGKYLFDNGEIIKLDDEFKIAKFNVSGNNAFVGSQVTLNIVTMSGKGPFNYKFAAKDASGVETVIQEYSSNNTVQWTPTVEGSYTLIAYAQDSTGKEVKKEKPGFGVSSLAIKEIKTSVPSPQDVGKKIVLGMDIENSANLELTCYYDIKSGENSQKLDATSTGEAEWTPSEAGEYTIVGHIESGEIKVEKTIQFVIEEEEVQLTKLVVFYRGLENPTMYYKDASSQDDYVNISMVPDSSMDDYKYRAEVDVPLGSQILVYFSDGFATEDNNDGQMYMVQPGYFGVKDNGVYNLSTEQGEYNGDEGSDVDEEFSQDDDEDKHDNGRGNNWFRDFWGN